MKKVRISEFLLGMTIRSLLVEKIRKKESSQCTIFVKPAMLLFLHVLLCRRAHDEMVTAGWTWALDLKPRPQGLLLVQNGGRRNPWPRLPKWLQKFFRISSHKHDEMSSFCFNNGFRLQRTKRAARRWKQPPKKPFHHVWHTKLAPAVLAAVKIEFSYVIIPHRNIGYIDCTLRYGLHDVTC